MANIEEFVNIAESMGDDILKEINVMKDLDEKLYDSLNDAMEQKQEKFGNALDKVKGFVESVPVLGDLVSKWMDFDNIEKEFQQGLINGVLGRGTKDAVSQIATSIGKIGVVALLYESINLFQKLDASAASFRETTGFTTTQMAEMKKYAHDIAIEYTYMGIGADKAYEATAALTNEFSNIRAISKDSVIAVSMLSTNFGIAESSAAGFLGIMRNLGVESQKMAINFSVATIKLAEAAGVAPKDIFEDIANVSSDILAYISDTPKELIRAAVKAKQLGLNLGDIANIADSLIDIESSISKQMEASVLLGKELNLNRARQLALEGDILGATESTLSAVGSLTDFNNLHFIQKKAVAAAAGLEVKELTKALRQQEAIVAMSTQQKEELKAANLELDKASEINSENYLKQQKMQSAMSKFKAMWEEIVILAGDVLLPILSPIVTGVSNILRHLMPVLKMLTHPIFLMGAGIIAMLSGMVPLGAALLVAGGAKLLGGLKKPIGEIPTFAGGVKNFAGGAAIVGEHGPELVTLPAGSNVTPNVETDNLLSSTSNNNNNGEITSLLNEVNSGIKKLSTIMKNQKTDVYLDGKKVTAGLINLEPLNGMD